MFFGWIPFPISCHNHRRHSRHRQYRSSPPVISSSISSKSSSSRLFLLIAALFTAFVVVCDGQQQQQFGDSSENRHGIGPAPTHCTEAWQFPCDDGIHCIARYDECDGIEQCPDASDEKHCQANERASLSQERGRHYTHQQQHGREAEAAHDQQHKQQQAQKQQQQQQHKQQTKSAVPKANAAGGDKRVPLELLLAGAAAFVLVSALVHAVMKATRRRRLAARGGAAGANRRGAGFRKGESLVDEEDDLLIAQMYG
ncbi:hypothetical protein niasHS_006406 [Heterodera schachtii]|uniref:Uncharacterized protein n=1 Tax=Heterodera schachtii TaxID=97005 RepID=A0ABD2JH54_HETSC